MAGDFNKPSGSSLRTMFMQEIRDMFGDMAKWFSGTSTANYPTGCIRYNSSTKKLEKYSGTVWEDLDLTGLIAGGLANKQNTEYAADTGAANVYAVTLAPVPPAYFTGMTVRVKIANTNTGSSTINVNTLGAKTIKKNVVEDLVLGDLMAGQIYEAVYNGTNFQLAAPPAQEKTTASDILSDFVVTGLLGTDPGASLAMTIPPGTAYVIGRRVVKLAGAGDLTRTYTASKDTYVDISYTGAITYSEVNNGAGAPSVAANSIRLMKVVTNATEITSVTDMRPYPGMKTASTAVAYAMAVRNSAKDLVDRNNLVLWGVTDSNAIGDIGLADATTVLATDTMVSELLSPPSVVAGDIVLVTGWMRMTKGGTAGKTKLGFVDVGSAGLDIYSSTTDSYQPASQLYEFQVCSLIVVNSSGTLDLDLVAASAGSNGTVAMWSSGFHGIFLKKQ